MTHEIVVEPVDRPKLDWHGAAYVAVCSCGRYRSQPYGIRSNAEQAGRHHAEAKNTATQAEKASQT